MLLRKLLSYLFCLVLLSLSMATMAQAPKTPTRITLSGVVTDSITGERLEFITLQEKGTTNGTITNTDGGYQLLLRSNSTLAISCVGYRTKEIKAGSKTRQLNIQLVPTEFQLSEVVVKPKREHYRRRENPSVALARNVIEHKHDHPLEEHDFYEGERLETTNYSFNNFSGALYRGWKKKFREIDQYVDTAFSGSPILPVSSDESFERLYFRKNPKSQKTVLEGKRHTGLDEMFQADFLGKAQAECFPEIDLDENSIYMFTNKFVNPLSKFAIAFYKFYILDTLTFDDGLRYVDLGFAPLVPEQFGFIGHMYVSTDSTYFLKKLEMSLPPDININFVRNMRFTLEQERLADSTRYVSRKSFESEMNLMGETSGIYAQREVRYGNYRFDEPREAQALRVLNGHSPRVELQGMDLQGDGFWLHYRDMMGDKSRHDQVSLMLREMRQNKFLRYSENVLSWLFKGYIQTDFSKAIDDNKFLYGPVTSTVSYNHFEGIRLRAGGLTTARLNRRWFGNVWGAYGCKDQEWKYGGKLEYSIHRKKDHFNEFPIHGFRLQYNYDTNILGSLPNADKDNFILSVKRDDTEKISYERRADLTYMREFYGGFSYELKGSWIREYSTPYAPFVPVGTGVNDPYYDVSMATLKLRYAPHETFIQNRVNRVSINQDHPVIELQHSIGAKGLLGSDFDYQRTDISYQQRYWLSAFGYIDTKIQAGKVWSKSPYALLCLPNVNLGYFIQKNSFTQMNPMEFVGDQFAQWDLVYYLNGWIFNTMPIMKKLKWREVVSFRGYYSSLSDKNNPEALLEDGLTLRNPDLYQLPSGGHRVYYDMPRGPYMEAAFGIENIFRVLRLEYVRRLSYLSHDGITKNGIQATVHVTF